MKVEVGSSCLARLCCGRHLGSVDAFYEAYEDFRDFDHDPGAYIYIYI